MSYVLRDEKGIMRMELSASVAKRMMDSCPGYFRPYHSKNKNKPVTAFQFTEDMVADLPVDSGKIYFWSGDILIPKN
jgi:hypothetical protein